MWQITKNNNNTQIMIYIVICKPFLIGIDTHVLMRNNIIFFDHTLLNKNFYRIKLLYINVIKLIFILLSNDMTERMNFILIVL